MFFVNENKSYSDDQEYLWQPTNVNSKPTILEKALEYREENPNEWKNRQIEIERDLLESRQHFEEDSFLDQYYMKLDKDNQVRKGLINLIRNEVRIILEAFSCFLQTNAVDCLIKTYFIAYQQLKQNKF